MSVDDAVGDGGDLRSDAELLARLRGRGADQDSTAAFATLYARHQQAARSLARQLARSPADADDLVAGAFTRMLEVLRAGRGPTEAFRAYLLTSVRHLAYDRSRAERRIDLTDDIADVATVRGVDPDGTVVPFTDPALAGLERTMAAKAFATLPERWQAVLWHLEVEGDTPADIAPLFGLTANAVSALGYRAREGLRQAYLQEHLDAGTGRWDRRHRETGEKLGAYTRGGLARREAQRVETHLAECAECRALAEELRDVNSGMVRSVVAPLVLGAGLVGYLASRGSTGPLAFQASTGELAVAGGGALGVLGALTGLAPRPAVPPRMRTVGVVGLAGAVGVAAFVLGDAVEPPALPPVQAGPAAPGPGPPAAAPVVPPNLPPGTLPPAAPPGGAPAAPRSPAAPDAALALPGLLGDDVERPTPTPPPARTARDAGSGRDRAVAAPRSGSRAPESTARSRTTPPAAEQDRGRLALLATGRTAAGDCLVTARLPALDTRGVICRTGTGSREASLDSSR